MTSNEQTPEALHAEIARLREQVATLEQQLHTCQEYLTIAQELNDLGVWDTNVQTSEIYWTPELERLYGLEPGAFQGTFAEFLAFIHPEDHAVFQQASQVTFGEQLPLFQVEMRIIRPDGSNHWSEGLARVVYDEQGRPVRMVGTSRLITERKRFEQQLRDSEARMRTLVEANPVPIVISRRSDGVVLYANEQLGLLFRQHDLVGKTTPNYYANAADRQIVLDTVRNEGKLISREFQMKRQDGSTFWAIMTVYPLLFDGQEAFFGSFYDISERKEMEEALRTFQTIVQAAPDGFYISDLTGTLIYTNPAYDALYGSPDSLIGTSALDVLAAEQDTLHAINRGLMEAGVWRGTLTYRRRDETTFTGSVTAFLLRNEQNEPYAITGIIRDRTEQQRAEQERIALQHQVIEAQQAALRELSTPLLPLADGIVALPLVGSIDSQRAQEIMETLLEGVAQQRAHLAIIDMTGVQVVDTQVASALIQAAQAARLLGARVVMTGIGPEMAQTLVHLGVDFGEITTLNSLQSGIAFALQR